MPKFHSVAPQFVVPDVVQAAEYYMRVFGFESVDYFLEPPVHAIVVRDRVRIFFAQAQGQSGTSNRTLKEVGLDAYIFADDVDQLDADFRRNGADIIEGPVNRAYDMREIVVRDLNGFTLVFGADIL